MIFLPYSSPTKVSSNIFLSYVRIVMEIRRELLEVTLNFSIMLKIMSNLLSSSKKGVLVLSRRKVRLLLRRREKKL
jgi:hypothetical protein